MQHLLFNIKLVWRSYRSVPGMEEFCSFFFIWRSLRASVADVFSTFPPPSWPNLQYEATAADALRSHRNLLRFKDIHRNSYHLETNNINNIKFLYVTTQDNGQKSILEHFNGLSPGLYIITIHWIESNSLKY